MKKFIQKLAKEYGVDYNDSRSFIISLFLLMLACFALGMVTMLLINLI